MACSIFSVCYTEVQQQASIFLIILFSLSMYLGSEVSPDDVDVPVLGGEVQRTGPVWISGVSGLGLQQSRTHVTAQKQLDHLQGQQTITHPSDTEAN